MKQGHLSSYCLKLKHINLAKCLPKCLFLPWMAFILFWVSPSGFLNFFFFFFLQMAKATIRGNSSNVKFLAIPLSFQILGKITGLVSMCPTLFLPSISKQLGLSLRERLHFATQMIHLSSPEQTIQLLNIQYPCSLHPDVVGTLFLPLFSTLTLCKTSPTAQVHVTHWPGRR